MTAPSHASSPRFSPDHLQTMQDRFHARMKEMVQKIMDRAGSDDAATQQQVSDILYARSRLGPLEKLGTADIAKAAAQGQDALKQLQTEEAEKNLFSPTQERLIAEAAAAREPSPLLDRVFGDADRIYIPVPRDIVSGTQKDITAWLAQHGYEMHDYAQGYARQQDGGIIRIGKLMNRHPINIDLKRSYENDLTRNPDVLIVLSRNAIDIARVSTGRAWWTCMAAGDMEWRQTLHDIKKNAVAAYVIKGHDPDITAPLARIRVLPYVRHKGLGALFNRDKNGQPPQEIAYVCGPAVGLDHETFKATVAAFCANTLNHGRDGLYHLTSGVFPDTLPYNVYKHDARLKGIF